MKRCAPKEWIASVEINEPRGGGYNVLRLRVPGRLPQASAGAFVMLSAGKEPEILLRRPMALYDVRPVQKGTDVSLMYTVVGRGTSALAKAKSGETLSFLGPIGNGFSKPRASDAYIVVAGGVGIAPFLLWARQLTAPQRKRVRILFGFRNKEQLPIVKDFQKAGLRPLCAVEGPGGTFKGTVIDLLNAEVAKAPATRILTCGPEKMMERAVDIAKILDIPYEASLEARMGCGVGVCLSCVTKFSPGIRPGGYALVCQDGPVFSA